MTPKHISTAANDRLGELRIMHENKEFYAPIKTGIKELDEAIGGITMPSMVAIGGPKKNAKTLFAVHLTMAIARAHRKILVPGSPERTERPLKIMYFHLEEVIQQLADRMALNLSDGMSKNRIRDIEMTQEDFDQYEKAVGEMNFFEVLVDDRTFGVDDIISEAVKNEADIIVIDTFNLLKGGRGANSQERLADISSRLLTARNNSRKTFIVIHHTNRETGEDLGTDALGRDADLRIKIAVKESAIVKQGMEGVAEITIENSRQAGSRAPFDVGLSFTGAKILNAATEIFDLNNFKTMIGDENGKL